MHSINHANILLSFLGLDTSIFPTEDDRHDVSTIMLFQSYTGCRPAELVHASKGKACQDPLGDAMDIDKDGQHQETVDIGCDRQH
jgi:hypothetical protein